MTLLPLKTETFVLPISAEEVEKKLWDAVFPVKAGENMPDKADAFFLFNGWVKGRSFRISRRINTPENFLPLMKGNIEETSLGSLLFIHYSLFFSSIFFLIFWSVITIFLTFFFIYFYNIVLYGAIAFGLGMGNYIIAIANFNIQVRKSRELLNKVLTSE